MRTNSMGLGRSALLAAGIVMSVVLVYAAQAGAVSRDVDCSSSCYTDSAPVVRWVTPQDGATGVPTTANAVVAFDKTMDSSTVNKDTFKLYQVNADGTTTQITDVTVHADPVYTASRFVLDPYGTSDRRLAPGQRYKAVVTTGVRSIYGVYLFSPKIWYFKTDPAPSVTGVTPPNGATGVTKATDLTVAFSEPVKNVTASTFVLERVSLNKDGVEQFQPVDATVSAPDALKAMLDPSADLRKGTYRATIANGVTDAEGNALVGAPYTWRFTVGG